MARKWEEVGLCVIDSGCVLMIDPAHVRMQPRDGHNNFDLQEEVEKWAASGTYGQQMGFGAIVATGMGDGEYPVSIKRDVLGRVAEVRIIFNQPEEKLNLPHV